MTELHGEKIDIVDYAEDPASSSPTRCRRPVSGWTSWIPEARIARVIVPDYQLSLAIGKEGQNARLAARLTGWKIDIVSDTAPVAAAPDSAAPDSATPGSVAPGSVADAADSATR